MPCAQTEKKYVFSISTTCAVISFRFVMNALLRLGHGASPKGPGVPSPRCHGEVVEPSASGANENFQMIQLCTFKGLVGLRTPLSPSNRDDQGSSTMLICPSVLCHQSSKQRALKPWTDTSKTINILFFFLKLIN